VFCYGATGAGKTFTMLGSVQQPGVMVLALKDLFAKLKQRSPEGEHVVRLSYLEVYNESVRDLLSPGRPLVLREDSKLVPLFERFYDLLLLPYSPVHVGHRRATVCSSSAESLSMCHLCRG
jgi:hypothetical protein